MDHLQELEIENERLVDEVAKLQRLLAKIHGLTALGLIHNQRVQGRGRPSGTTRWSERVFVKALYDHYEALPEDRRTRIHVARAMGISRRTLHRYMEQWSILWPPSEEETLEEVLDRLKGQEDAPKASVNHSDGQPAA